VRGPVRAALQIGFLNSCTVDADDTYDELLSVTPGLLHFTEQSALDAVLKRDDTSYVRSQPTLHGGGEWVLIA
jgi:hypothetical protein